jgi:Protein of unknown function (DUF3179)
VRNVAVVALVLALTACGSDEPSEAERLRSVEERLETLEDLGPGLGEADAPRALTSGWRTDFSKHAVPLAEFRSGGPGKDGIPALDRPQLVPAREVDFLESNEPVLELVVDGDARAYPIQILIWHEIANDVVAGVPVAVTFCPLCNTAVVFDRRVDGRTLDFGTTGNLRNSDLVMYDRQTETWWQQFGGRALVGELTGARLEQLPARIVAWREFLAAHPRGRVLSRETGHERPYGRNPYPGYDDASSPPIFPSRNNTDARLAPKERVVFFEAGGAAFAVPFSTLRARRVIRLNAAGRGIVVRWRPGVASSLDAEDIAEGRNVGSAEVLEDGRLVPFDQPFWFAVAAFRPDVEIVR